MLIKEIICWRRIVDEFLSDVFSLIALMFCVDHCLVDDEFLQEALHGRIMLKEQLPKMLQADATPYTTTCIDAQLKKKGKQKHDCQPTINKPLQ